MGLVSVATVESEPSHVLCVGCFRKERDEVKRDWSAFACHPRPLEIHSNAIGENRGLDFKINNHDSSSATSHKDRTPVTITSTERQ